MEKPWLKFYEEGVPHTIDYPPYLLHELLDHVVERFPDRPAVIFGASVGSRLLTRTITYRELGQLADRFAAGLQSLGVKKGDRVAIQLPNCPQFPIAFYGTLKAGGVVVSTSPLYVAREIEYQLRDAGAQVLVTLTRNFPEVEKARPHTPLRHVIVTNIKEYFPAPLKLLFSLAVEKKEGHYLKLPERPGNIWLQDFLAKAPAKPEPVPLDQEDLALLQYTGGTTGISKGAMLTHRNMVVNTIQVRSWLTDTKEGQEVALCAAPFFHVYGMTVGMSFGVYVGATMVLMANPRHIDEMLMLIDKFRPTVFPGVPTMYVAINNHPDVAAGKYHLRSIRACISGSAPLPVEVKAKFEELTGGKLVEGYGLTEAAPVTHCNPIYGLNKAGSIGLPFPDVDAKIVDLETGEKELPVGEIGELILRGPQVMKGYWNMPEETAIALRNGWLYTGDVAKMDEDGYFYIVDRKKDMIISGGFNIYPREIEDVLYEHPAVKEAVAAGVPDEYRGEMLKVYIVPKEGMTITEEEIIEFCRQRLAKYKVPRAVEFRTELPKTLVGKFLRRALVEEERRRLEEKKKQQQA
ncbi:MAG: long-chain-fatty-acid--CoA ligase [Anaerolineae bacterium]